MHGCSGVTSNALGRLRPIGTTLSGAVHGLLCSATASARATVTLAGSGH